jgi:predicted N-acetyltransferase YhbS
METLEYNNLPMSLLGSERPAELSRIIVAPQSRGQNIARALTEVVIKNARFLGIHVLFLECIASDVPRYRKYEFEPIVSSILYPHLIVKDDVVTMRRRL